MNIADNRIRESGPAGDLSLAGYRWAQFIVWRQKLCIRFYGCVMACFFPTLMMWEFFNRGKDGFVWTWDTYVFAYAAPVNWGLAAVCIVLYPFIAGWVTQTSAVAFSASGEIWVAQKRGLFQRSGAIQWGRLAHPLAFVASIELSPMRNRVGGHYMHGGQDGYPAYYVWMYFKSGERCIVGQYLEEDEAYIVCEQLKIAHKEARDAVALAA